MVLVINEDNSNTNGDYMPTLSELTRNNTSMPDSFKGLPTLNVAAPGNVSKVPISLPRKKLGTHRTDWFGFGGGAHPNVGYRVDDPDYFVRTTADMMERGFYFAVPDWYGKGHHTDTAALLLKRSIIGKDFRMCMNVDGGTDALEIAGKVDKSGDVTGAMLSTLDYMKKTFINPDTYMFHTDGRALVFFFSVGQYKLDWTKVRTTFPDMAMIFREKAAFGYKYSDGGFAWVSSSNEDFYKTGLATKKIVVGSLNPGFNNTDRDITKWGNINKIDQKGGERWLDQINLGKKWVAHYYIANTWNDINEGTAIEPGLDGLSVVSSVKDGLLRWDVQGSPRVIHHVEVYGAPLDQPNLKLLTDQAMGSGALDVIKAFQPGKYQFYVKVVGINSMKNAISNQVRGEIAPCLRALP